MQVEKQTIHPHAISQRLRIAYGVVSICLIDNDLPIEEYRAYMLRGSEKADRSAEDPELYTCIVSGKQSQAWQMLSWAKEILQVLDKNGARTDSKSKLSDMIANRSVTDLHADDTPSNVIADKDGLVLAIGSVVPMAYRKILRNQRVLEHNSIKSLEPQLLIPSDFIEYLLVDDFEVKFEQALAKEDSQT
jgi:hypothetical protein